MPDHRSEIIAALRDARGGLDVNALASRLELHANTIRWHLHVLDRDGLVVSGPERRGRGRPAIVYRLSPDGIVHDRDEYRLLATMLTAAVAGDANGEARSYDVGRAWGKAVGSAGRNIVELLDDQGFAATADGDTIEMRRCPFWTLAAAHPDVICTLHHGLIDGALEAAGTGREVGELTPFAGPTLCVARLRPS